MSEIDWLGQWEAIKKKRIRAVDDFSNEFCVTRLEILTRFGEPSISFVISRVGILRAIICSKATNTAVSIKLGERYKQDPSRQHLRKYARFQLENDLSM